MFWRCKHKWEKVSDETLPSPWEQVSKRAVGKISMGEASYHFYSKTHIVILTCTVCGKINKTITKS